MITDVSTTAAYLCPYCSKINIENMNVFSLRTHTRLLCHDRLCGEECVDISVSGDKYRIDAECPVCGERHAFFASKQAFWNRDLLAFSCNMEPSIDILCIGEAHSVRNAAKHGRDRFEELAAAYDEGTELVNRIYVILEALTKLAHDGKLSCKCGSHDVYPEFDSGVITLFCDKCGESADIEPSDAVIDLLGTGAEIVLGKNI